MNITICACSFAVDSSLINYRYRLPRLEGQCAGYCGDGADPLPPPLPPLLPPGATTAQRVTTTFVLRGDVSTFDVAGFKAALVAQFASALQINLEVTSASVRVVAKIDFASFTAARAAATEINTTSMSVMQRVWFASVAGEIILEQQPQGSISKAIISLSEPPSPPAARSNVSALVAEQSTRNFDASQSAGMVAAVVIPLILVAMLLAMLWKYELHFKLRDSGRGYDAWLTRRRHGPGRKLPFLKDWRMRLSRSSSKIFKVTLVVTDDTDDADERERTLVKQETALIQNNIRYLTADSPKKAEGPAGEGGARASKRRGRPGGRRACGSRGWRDGWRCCRALGAPDRSQGPNSQAVYG